MHKPRHFVTAHTKDLKMTLNRAPERPMTANASRLARVCNELASSGACTLRAAQSHAVEHNLMDEQDIADLDDIVTRQELASRGLI